MGTKYTQHAVGKRKTSIARLYLKPGNGEITINKKPMDEYYLRPTSKMLIMQPLELTNLVGKFDLNINVCGGGLQGQAGAIRHALAKALADMDVSAVSTQNYWVTTYLPRWTFWNTVRTAACGVSAFLLLLGVSQL